VASVLAAESKRRVLDDDGIRHRWRQARSRELQDVVSSFDLREVEFLDDVGPHTFSFALA
jgi:hypothetical protein